MTVLAEQTTLSEDAQAILLLCARLKSGGSATPLSAGEYAAVADVLLQRELRPRMLLRADEELLREIVGALSEKWRKVSYDRVQALLSRGAAVALATTRWLSAGVWIRSRAERGYPTRYKRKLGKSAPPLVFGIGNMSLLERGGLAVVGSRKPDPASEDFTITLAREAALHNVQIVSGAATGVDELSMAASTEAGGTSVGVVADNLIKTSLRGAFRRAIIGDRLCLITSYDPEAGFNVANAMGRNKWIYALADRAVVVAASEERGGTWAGATEALRRGETVYVKTGNPARPANELLIPLGARPVPDNLPAFFASSTSDVDVIGTPTPSSYQRAETERTVLSLVTPLILEALSEPIGAKALAIKLNLTQKQINVWLEELITRDKVIKLGSKYALKQAAAPMPSLF